MRKLIFLMMFVSFAAFSACSDNDDDLQSDVNKGSGASLGNTQLSAGTYAFEGEGFGGPFTITLASDGSASFYEGYLSSYIGEGTWKVKGGILTVDDGTFSNNFKVCDDGFEFLPDGSTNFIHIKLKEGDKFSLYENPFLTPEIQEE